MFGNHFAFGQGSEWQIYELSNASLYPQEQIFKIQYRITNAELEKIEVRDIATVIEISSTDQGLLEIVIPKNLHYTQDSGLVPQDIYFIIVDGEEVDYEQLNSVCDITYSIPFKKNSKIIEMLPTIAGISPLKPFKVPDDCIDRLIVQKILPPRKQMANGIPTNKIVCKEGLKLIERIANGKPSCVKPTTLEELIKRRGWVAFGVGEIYDKIAKETAEKFIISNLDEKYTVLKETIQTRIAGVRESLPPHYTVAVAFSALNNENNQVDKFVFTAGVSYGDEIGNVTAKIWDEKLEAREEIEVSFKEVFRNLH